MFRKFFIFDKKKMKLIKTLLLILLGIVFFIACNKNDEPEKEPEPEFYFQNEFDTSEPWLEFDNESGFGTVENGEFIFEHKIEDIDYWYTLYFLKYPPYNYTLETAIRMLESSDDFMYGLSFNRKDSYNHYYMYLHENSCILGYLYNYHNHLIYSETSLESILLDGEYNILRVENSLNKLTYYINGDKIFEYDMIIRSGEKFGFKLRSKGKIAIDYIRIQDIE